MFFNTILLALRSIRRNLLRSFLTILGIVIGVSAVITMVTLGNGATLAVQQQIFGEDQARILADKVRAQDAVVAGSESEGNVDEPVGSGAERLGIAGEVHSRASHHVQEGAISLEAQDSPAGPLFRDIDASQRVAGQTYRTGQRFGGVGPGSEVGLSRPEQAVGGVTPHLARAGLADQDLARRGQRAG